MPLPAASATSHCAENDIEQRFGTILAERILSLPELRGLVQKDTSGAVMRLDRVFRGRYNPQGEIDNLRRVLSSVRGSLDKKSKYYAEIGKSIQAGNALTVNGAKTFDDLFRFLSSVAKLWKSNKKQITIPQLEHIDRKGNPALAGDLESELVRSLARYKPGGDVSLFLDSEESGYLPDSIEAYELIIGHGKPERVDTYLEVFERVALILSAIPKFADREAAYHKMSVRLTSDAGPTEQRPLSHFVCGDIVHKGESYFINNRLW